MKKGIQILFFYLLLIQGFSNVFGQGLPKACGGTLEGYRIQGALHSTFHWTAQGGTVQRIDSIVDTVNNITIGIAYVLWDRSPGIHTISVAEQNVYSCFGPVNIDSVDVEVPEIEILGKDQVICAVDTPFTFYATPGFEYYVWNKDSKVFDSTTHSSFLTHGSGIYTVLTRTYIDTRPGDSVRCTLSDTLSLVVNAMPMVNLGNDTVLCYSEQVELIAGVSDSLYTYSWSTGEVTESITVPEGVQAYWVKVTSPKGCVTYDTINVLGCTRSYLLGEIPNTFTPNDDGDNDFWTLTKLADFPLAKVEIYDRSGRLVWSTDKSATKSITVDWNGKDLNNRDLPMGGYFYIINVNRPGAKPISGHINLVR